MMRLLSAAVVAGAMATALHAQEIKTTTTVKTDGKTVVYAGCVQPGQTTSDFLLSGVVPVKRTNTEVSVDDHGLPQTTTTTSYVLVPSTTMNFAASVGRKVEVTAIEIPRGDDRTTIETKTETEIEHQPKQEIEVKEKIAQRDVPQLRVVAVRNLNQGC